MIKLTALSGSEFYLNIDLIYKVEPLADSLITLTDGKTLRVKESADEIVQKIVTYKRQIFGGFLEGDAK
jgi:flagellar protein FlbD